MLRRIALALDEARDAGLLDHRGLEGQAREVFVRGLLKPLMPPNAELGYGKIIDSLGGLSSEVDVVIYSPVTMPPLVYDVGFAAYPVEACPYAIEVKTKLTATEVRDVVGKFRRLRDLKTLPTLVDLQTLQPIGAPCPLPIPALFAYGSDLSPDGKSELDRYREYDPEADTAPLVSVFCVVGRGYWWFCPDASEKKWVFLPPTETHVEVLEFLAGVANTVPDSIAMRGRPKIGSYLIDGRQFERL